VFVFLNKYPAPLHVSPVNITFLNSVTEVLPFAMTHFPSEHLIIDVFVGVFEAAL